MYDNIPALELPVFGMCGELYVMFCRELAEFRDVNLVDFKTQVCYFLNNEIVPKIVKKFKHFSLNY